MCRTPNPRRGASLNPPGARRGLSLLELMVTITVIGILASVAITRMGHTTLANLRARSDARQLAVDLVQAQRRSISSGENHFLNFERARGAITGYTLYRRTADGDIAVDTTRPISDGVTMSARHATSEFDFEGSALAAYQVTVSGPDGRWIVSVVPVTGAVRVVRGG